MTEQPPSAIGTVAQEAARLIEDMATMARSGVNHGDDPSPYAWEPAQERVWPDAPGAAGEDEVGVSEAATPQPGRPQAGSSGTRDHSSTGVCSVCGAERDDGPDETRQDLPATCRLCPLCKGIALLRSVRPETVDLLADLAMSMAASLRDVAARSRAADPKSSAGGGSGGPPRADRSPVQDIPVNDGSEG